jgi:hypothetical protein
MRAMPESERKIILSFTPEIHSVPLELVTSHAATDTTSVAVSNLTKVLLGSQWMYLWPAANMFLP